jgi:hypothetical protein
VRVDHDTEAKVTVAGLVHVEEGVEMALKGLNFFT